MLAIENRNGEPITSLAEGQALAPPAAAHHWVPGRSAFELARAWSEGDAGDATAKLLRSRPELAGVRLDRGYAERKTRVDAISIGPRNHDLLVVGDSDEGRARHERLSRS